MKIKEAYLFLSNNLELFSSMSARPAVIGGKLKLKGSSSASASTSSSKKRKSEELLQEIEKESNPLPVKEVDSLLTATERKHRQKKQELEARTMKKMSGMTYRERVEAFNSRLSSMTEHNDIPRVSAAGNG